MSKGAFRNNPCRCGSKKKYKSCHLYIDQGYVETSTGWIPYTDILKAREKIEDEKRKQAVR